jgi:YHS domain-containing protein
LLIVSVVAGGVWFLSGCAPSGKEDSHMSGSHQSAVKAGQEVVECPVMGTKFPASHAFGKTVYNGVTYYFCCKGCPAEFEKNPGKYVK